MGTRDSPVAAPAPPLDEDNQMVFLDELGLISAEIASLNTTSVMSCLISEINMTSQLGVPNADRS